MVSARDVETSPNKLLYVPSAVRSLSIPAPLRDAAHYVLHAAFCGRAIRSAKSSWVPRNSVFLQKVSRACASAKRWLVEEGVLETNGTYQAAVASTGYRWAPGYDTACRVPASNAITRSILKWQRRHDAALSIGARHLIAQLRHIRIDAAAAYETIRTLEPSNRSAWSPEQYRSFLYTSVRLLADGDIYTVVDGYGRLHTPITSLHRDLRRHLRLFDATSGAKLINLDIRNSQPLCLGLLLSNRHAEAHHARPEPAPDHHHHHHLRVAEAPPEPWSSIDDNPMTSRPYSLVVDDIPYVDGIAGLRHVSGKMGDRPRRVDWLHHHRERELGADVADYLRTCESGRFYETLMRFFPAVRDAEAFMTPEQRDELRSSFKAQVFGEILFGPTKDTELTRTFRELWPAVWDRVVAEKGGPDGYPALARAMQRHESALMIERIGERLAIELPHVPVATIHDSILVASAHVDHVRAIMMDEWARAGLRPSIDAKAA